MAGVVAAGQVPRIVVANTSSGIYKHEPFDVIIDVRDIPELQGLKIKDGSVTVGAAVSISDVIRLAETVRRCVGGLRVGILVMAGLCILSWAWANTGGDDAARETFGIDY